MAYQSMVCAIPLAIALSCAQSAMVEAAAQELQQCFIGSAPCGTPEELYQKIHRCLQDPRLCHEPAKTVAIAVPSAGATGLNPQRAAVQTDATLSRLAARTGMHRAADASRTISPLGEATVRLPAGAAASADNVSTTVDDVARSLPLDPATGNLNDTMPNEPGIVELRLGLRRTRVAGIDMRARMPSAEEIVQALAPGNGALQ